MSTDTLPTLPTSSIPDGTACTNIGRKGRRMRLIFGAVGVGIGAGLLVAGIVGDWSWWARALAGLPVAGGVTSGLQARRGVCVAHARTGSREDDEMHISRLPKELESAIRATAATITRDGAIAGAVVAVLGAASAFLK